MSERLLRKLPGRYVRKAKYEFDPHIKELSKLKTGYTDFVTGEPETRGRRLQVHHGLAINVWFYYFRNIVPVSLLTSVENAIPLMDDTHILLHEQANMEHYVQMAEFLLYTSKKQPKLFDTSNLAEAGD